MDEVIVAKLKAREEETRLADPVEENCEICDHPMSEGCIGWCSRCDANMKHNPYDDLAAAGGIFHVRMTACA